MNNFPAMTEAQRQELIELCEAVLAGHVQYGGDSNEEDIYKTALAALTAEPVKTKLKYSSALPKFIGDTNEVESVHCWVHGDTPEFATNEEAYAEAQKMTGDLYTAPPAPVLRVPDGWKLVPIEPTEDMVIRGFESKPDQLWSTPEEWAEYEAMSGCQQAAHKATLCWQAMLAAAPEVE
ncbi:hypothetical protein [Pantoea dispersa]|uniref:hypothetical protein n=1 Tax=Pantoea dispersa TaxID=59814 RepID=UPI00301B57F9